MKHLFLLSVLVLTACSMKAPQVAADKGAVYGVLMADAHSEFKAKQQQLSVSSSDPYATTKETNIIHQDNLVNYAVLDDLYVGLVVPTLSVQQHTLHVSAQGISPRSVALATGDILQVYNDTTLSQTFFVTQTPDSGDGIQSFPSLAAGSSANYTIQLVGNLELQSENNDHLKANLFSRKNMLTKRLSSGGTYQFENLNPGQYSLIFWYWRLGKIEQQIQIKQGESIRVDKTLSVDNIMRSL